MVTLLKFTFVIVVKSPLSMSISVFSVDEPFSAAFAREMGRTPLEYRRYGALKEVLNDTDINLHV